MLVLHSHSAYVVAAAGGALRYHRSYLQKILVNVWPGSSFHFKADRTRFVFLFSSSKEVSFNIVKSAMAIGPPLLILSISDLSRLAASSGVKGRFVLWPSLACLVAGEAQTAITLSLSP